MYSSIFDIFFFSFIFKGAYPSIPSFSIEFYAWKSGSEKMAQVFQTILHYELKLVKSHANDSSERFKPKREDSVKLTLTHVLISLDR